jgi:methylthioribulose-1-phosphate dehydratase
MSATDPSDFRECAERLAAFGREVYGRGWAVATSGNFSVVTSRDPLRLAITSSGRDKGRLVPEEIVEVDAGGAIVRGQGRPSAETSIHLTIVRARGAGAVAHVHTIASTTLSEAHAAECGLEIAGFEMLKAFDGVSTHEHREWVPILENTQDWEAAAGTVEEVLRAWPGAHGLLIRGHGLYTWGRDLGEAKRHLEAFEFLLEVVSRRAAN